EVSGNLTMNSSGDQRPTPANPNAKQYGPTARINLRIPPRPPGYAFLASIESNSIIAEECGSKDFLQMLLDPEGQKDSPRSLNKDQIKALLMDEPGEVIGVHMVIETHLPKLTYLDAVIKETFRSINVWTIHHDPQNWINPLEFKPKSSNMQTQTSNTLHNAIIEAGSKDRPPMLAPGNYVQWKSRIKRYIDTKPNHELIHYCLTNPPYELGWKEKVVLDSEGNPTTSTERSQELKTVSHHKLYDILKQHQNEVNELRAERIARAANPLALVAQQQPDNSLRISRSTGYDNQRLGNVAGARETVGTTVVQKSRIQCYNCKEFGHVAKECQKPKREKDADYHREKMILCKQEEAGNQFNAEQADWRDDTDDESKDQELEAHYMYMAQIQEVSPDAANNSGPIFDAEPL
nr:cytochrome P450 76C1-like [Tanacetum cinerariifolium]